MVAHDVQLYGFLVERGTNFDVTRGKFEVAKSISENPLAFHVLGHLFDSIQTIVRRGPIAIEAAPIVASRP